MTETTLYRHRKRRFVPGFTLVELLVVIGIISLLISILLPSLARARQTAQATACLSNMRQLGMANQFFVNEYDGWTPKTWENSGPFADPNTNPDPPVVKRSSSANEWRWSPFQWGWDSVYKYYTESSDVFRCPGDDSEGIRGAFNDTAPAAQVPFGPEWDNIPASYRMNASNNSWIVYSFKQTHLPDPSRSIMLFESNPDIPTHHAMTYFAAGVGDANPSNLHPLFPYNVASFRHGSDRQGVGNDEKKPKFYNKRRLNYQFHDGHAEPVVWSETWQPVGKDVVVGGETQVRSMWRQLYEPSPFGNIIPNVEPASGVWD